MGLFDGIVESLKRDLEELLGSVDIQAFILLVKQYTIDRMMDSESLSGLGNAIFSAGSKDRRKMMRGDV